MQIELPIKIPYKTGYKHGDMTFYGKPHRGIDLIVPIGTPLYSPLTGQIVKMSQAVKEGKELKIQAMFGKDKVISYFAHLNAYENSYVKPLSSGSKVTKGELIAYSGNSGTLTTGAHLHWHLEVNGVIEDPMQYVAVYPILVIDDFTRKWLGHIIIDTEDKGKLYYVDFEGYRHFLNPKSLETFKGLQKVSTGFTHKDIKKIKERFL